MAAKGRDDEAVPVETIYAMDCTTGAVYVGSDPAQMQQVFADAEAVRRDELAAEQTERERMAAAAAAEEQQQKQMAELKAERARQAMAQLQATHPQVADAIATILS